MEHIGDMWMKSADLWARLNIAYEIGPQIANGRDGTVIRKATCKTTRDVVALKIMNCEDDEDNRARGLLEASVLSKLKHPNIISIRAVYECSAAIILVLEYAPGGDLREAINTWGRLPESFAKRLFYQLVCALEYMYSNNVAHRDIKLDNILLKMDSTGELQLKVADFGFAGYLTDEPFTCPKGTLEYAAPELFSYKCSSYRGEEVDVYSAGVVLYAMLTARLPFLADNDETLLSQIRCGLFQIPPHVSEEAAALIRTMMSPCPSARPTIEELLSGPWLAEVVAMKRPKSPPAQKLGEEIRRRSATQMITHKLFNRIKGTDKKERKSTSSEKTASSGSDKEAERKEKKERKKREKELKKEKKKASDEEKKEKREKEKEQKEKKSKDKKEKEEGSRVRFNLYPQSHGSAIAGRPAPLASPMVCT